MTDDIQTSDFPEAWKPNPGETITGVLEQVEVIDPNGQGPYPCVTIKTADGTLRALHAFHSVLSRELARRRPKPGDELTVVYHGKREGGAYGSYHSYAVSSGQGREVDWDTFLPAEERMQTVPPNPDPVPIAPAPVPAVPEQAPGAQFGDDPPF